MGSENMEGAEIPYLIDRAERAEARVKKLEDALAWFADEANYDSDGPDHDSAVQAYGEEKARNALSRTDGV